MNSSTAASYGHAEPNGDGQTRVGREMMAVNFKL